MHYSLERALPGARAEGFQLALRVGPSFALPGGVLALLIIRTEDSKAATSAEGQTEVVG